MARSYWGMVIFIRNLPWRRIASAGAITVAVIGVLYTANFFWPRIVNFSLVKTNCFLNPIVLPGLVKAESNDNFDVQLESSLGIGGLILYSAKTCVIAKNAPQANVTENLAIAPFGNPIIKKSVQVNTTNLPSVSSVLPTTTPISANHQIVFRLDLADQLFTYQLKANQKEVNCDYQADKLVVCDLKKLSLAQSASYQIKLWRLFNGQYTETVFTGQIKTIDAVKVISASISPGQKVFDAPTELLLTFNKALTSYHNLKLTQSNNNTVLPISIKQNAKQVSVHFDQALPRGATFKLSLEQATASDGGYLDQPYTLTFSTSTGPQVIGISIGSYKVATNASITINFDSPLAAGQNLIHFIRLERDAGQMDASYSLNANRVTVTPRGGMPGCTAFRVKVIDGLKSNTGISGGSGTWLYSSRTICQTVFSIGTSVNGRSILAYKFGSGAQKVIFVGGLHGNERSATYILRSLIDYLEANVGAVPAGRTIIIIPSANPDGYAANRRTNSNNVDLNRNFPANNWKAGVTEPGGAYLPYGGGNAPLSEPESRALANYVAGQHPILVMSYHAAAYLVAANESGNSLSLASLYGHKTGYPVYGNEAASQFDYDTTGAFEDWLHDAHSIACILVELKNKTGNEFNNHRSAMLGMIQF